MMNSGLDIPRQPVGVHLLKLRLQHCRFQWRFRVKQRAQALLLADNRHTIRRRQKLSQTYRAVFGISLISRHRRNFRRQRAAVARLSDEYNCSGAVSS